MGACGKTQDDESQGGSKADQYTMSDNYHQAVNGGTGANHIMLGSGDAYWFSDGKGNPLTPPDNGVDPTMPGTPLPGHTTSLSEIENPNPQPGTNNYYTEGGYGGGSGSPTAMPAQGELRRRQGPASRPRRDQRRHQHLGTGEPGTDDNYRLRCARSRSPPRLCG